MFIKVFKKHRNQFLKFFFQESFNFRFEDIYGEGLSKQILGASWMLLPWSQLHTQTRTVVRIQNCIRVHANVAFSIVLADFVGGDD